MLSETEHVPLSDELLAVMRKAASKAIELREPFVSPRTMLLALLEDPAVGPALRSVVNVERLMQAQVTEASPVLRVAETRMENGEQPALLRHDTLAFKTSDGKSSMWLSHDAYTIFLEGAQRVESRYAPMQLALGFAAQAIHAPGLLLAINIEPGVLADAIYKL